MAREPTSQASEASPGVSRWKPEGGWEVEEVLRLGSLGGTAPDVFGEVRAIEVTPNGDVLVFDHFGNELRRFDDAGEYMGALGGTGAGPGEFRGVVGMTVRSNGEIWIVDGPNARYTIVDSAGEVRTIQRTARVVTRPWVGGFDPEGRLHDLATEVADNGLVDMLLRISDDGSVISKHPLPRVVLPVPTLGGGVMVPLPFAPRLLQMWDPRGAVWQAVTSEYRIARIDLSGDTTHLVVVDRDRQDLTRGERDSLNAIVREAESRFGIDIEADMRPNRVPIIRWFVVDEQGHLWVCATGRDPCNTVDVHSPAAGFLGSIELPVALAAVPPPVLRDGRIYGVTEGTLGEPQVFVGRVRRY